MINQGSSDQELSKDVADLGGVEPLFDERFLGNHLRHILSDAGGEELYYLFKKHFSLAQHVVGPKNISSNFAYSYQ